MDTKESIYIYGAGEKGRKLCRQIRFCMSKSEIENKRLFLVDKDPEKCGREYMGVEILSVEEAIAGFGQNDIMFSTVPHYTPKLYAMGFRRVLGELDYIQRLLPDCLDLELFSNVRPFDHYESPYPPENYIKEYSKETSKTEKVADIDLNIKGQYELIRKFSRLEKPRWSKRYKPEEDEWLGVPSADGLYYMMRTFRPKRIIEIGSGYSTAVMIDVNESYFDDQIQITSIEPYPNRLYKLLCSGDKLGHRKCFVQEIDKDFFRSLEKNDILFIDSSHVCKHGGDVNYEIFDIFPVLKNGILIHIHDIFYPFIYPERWIMEGRAYNEIYILRAFLMNNKDYEIELFTGYGRIFEDSDFEIPESMRYIGQGSLWIRKK